MIVALDLETTGLDNLKDTIIEVALIKIDSDTFEILDTYNTFVNPQIEIPEIISNITNIRDVDVQDSPLFSDILEEVTEFIGDCPILGHNTNFDRGFLISHGVSIERNLVLDTFFLANFLLSHLKSLNLGFICSHLGIAITSEHRAIYDTEATVEVYKHLIQLLQKSTKLEKDIYRYVTDISQDKQGIFYRERYLEKVKKETEEEIIEQILSTIDTNKKSHKIEQKYEDAPEDIDSIFEEFDDFEKRENQKKMAHVVYDSLTSGKQSVIEAPTGIGKTFAYLIPSIVFSVKLGEQVFISTSTKTLQDQIFFKDLEFLSENLACKFSYTKLKGKRNYIGIYALIDFIESRQSYDPAETTFLLKVIFWLLHTHSGELDELDFYGEEYSFVREINASLPYTFHADNPYSSQEFVIGARDRAKNSNIVIINNHILFQDIVSEGRLLGKVKNIILDEAHSLEDVVTQSLKKGFSLIGVEKTFIELEKHVIKQGEILDDLPSIKDKILFDMTALTDIFTSYVHSKVGVESRYKNVLIKPEFFLENTDAELLAINLKKSFQELFVYLGDELSEKKRLLIGREISYFQEVQDILAHIFSDDQQRGEIIPILTYKDNYGLIVEYTLLNPGNFLQKQIWNNLESAVLTSATLQIDESFSYIQNILSLHDFDLHALETDFDYKKQSLLYIPNDLGSIKYNSGEIFLFFQKLFPLIGGRTLVLFTAFAMIQECYLTLNQDLKGQNINLLAQSIGGSKQKQIDFFKKNSENSILIGTDSFWEGVDIAGDDLKYLIIHKVPFMVPSDPIFQARSTLFKNSFSEYSIPKSILKLKQGFGRLIRTKSDTGMVIFLDDRIYSTSWGEVFLKAFPKEMVVRRGSSQNLLDVIKK